MYYTHYLRDYIHIRGRLLYYLVSGCEIFRIS